MLDSITDDTEITNMISDTSCKFIMGYLEENNFFEFLKDKSPKEVYDQIMESGKGKKSMNLDDLKEKAKSSMKEKGKELLLEEIHQGIDENLPDIPGFDYKDFLPDSLK